jgi:hypothetical protein
VTDLNRFEAYPGDDLAPRLKARCGSGNWLGSTCDRVEGHPGEHVEVSGTDLILDVWGDDNAGGGIDNRTRAAIEELADIDQMLSSAIDEAESRLRSMLLEYGDDPVLKELIDSADVPWNDGIGLTEDESAWPAEIDAIRRRIAKRKAKAS